MSGGYPHLANNSTLWISGIGAGIGHTGAGQGSIPFGHGMFHPHQQSAAWAMQQSNQLLAMQAQAQAMAQPRWMKADPKVPDTMGWREWFWNEDRGCLMSPSQGTFWETAEHAAIHWDEHDVVRGVAGIHALMVPRHWKLLNEFGWTPLGAQHQAAITVTGIVERFGKYVLGTEGWRAEQVVIRELLAPNTEIGLKLEQKYPDVIVHYSDQGEEPCKSEKSSGLEKGSRSLLPSLLPSPVSSPPPSPSIVLIPTFGSRAPSQIANWSPSDDEAELASATTPAREALMALMPLWAGVAACWAILLGLRFLA